jgi:hypothetical protein
MDMSKGYSVEIKLSRNHQVERGVITNGLWIRQRLLEEA